MDSQLEFEFLWWESGGKVLLSKMALSRFYAWYSDLILRAYCLNIYTVPEGPWRPALSSASEVFRNHAYFESAFSG